MRNHNRITSTHGSMAAVRLCMSVAVALACAPVLAEDLSWPPKLPGGERVVTFSDPALLRPTTELRDGVEIAKTPPTVDFLYYDCQTYPGNPWSVWGDSLAVGDKYYSAVGDHLAPAGNAFVYEYDPATKKLRKLVDVKKLLDMPEGHYVPGKIHSRIDMGSDGWLYFATHRGSTRVTTDEYHYKGDWILRHHPDAGKTEIVKHAPVSKHCIPTSVLDPKRMIFYGGTAAGNRKDPVMFFAYDVRNDKVLHTDENGPYRYLIFAPSTGRVYYVNKDEGPLMRYDPATGDGPKQIDGVIGLRAATHETDDHHVYTVSSKGDATLWRFNTQTEKIDKLDSAAVGRETYIASIDIDPTGRYLYYIAGAHGGAYRDGTPVVQYDLKTRTRKVIAFLHPVLQQKVGYVPIGTYGSALSPDGDKLYITWNGNREGLNNKKDRYGFDTTALTVIHIPESERQP